MNPKEWAPMPNYEGLYEINRNGEVRSLYKRNFHKMISQREDQRSGYLTVRLSKAGKVSTFYIHRLMGEAFIPQPVGFNIINHINGHKQDNRIENLEWVTHSQNIRHAYKIGLCKTENLCKPVVDVCTGAFFKSIKEAANRYGLNYKTCVNYLNGNRQNPTCLKLAG